MIFLDKLGWPIETIRGRPVLNFLRRCIHTRRIVRTWAPTKQEPDDSNSAQQLPHTGKGENDE